MSGRMWAGAVVAFVGVVSAGCTDRSPVGPSAAASGGGSLSARPERPAAGTYELSFHVLRRSGDLENVSTLPVRSEELILKAEVRDSSGLPALTGTVVFEYCSYRKLPPNDLERADEAPAAVCETNLASWNRLGAVGMAATNYLPEEPGTAIWAFGVVHLPRTVGFRFRFVRQDGSVASGIGGPGDLTWTANEDPL